MIQVTGRLLVEHLETGIRCGVVRDYHIHQTLRALLVQFGAHRGTVGQFEVFHQCLPQGEMPENVPSDRAQYLSRCFKVQDALDLDADHTHIVACVILRHPDELADVTLWRIPVYLFSDMHMPAPDRDSNLQFLDITDQRP